MAKVANRKRAKERNAARPAEAVTSVQRVYSAFRDAIITCAVRPGEPISEQALAERYHTSRTPIREACSLLYKEGFLDCIPHKGFFVPEITLQKLQDLVQARIIVESACAEIAARQFTLEHLAEIERYAAPDARGKKKESLLEYIERNKRFHVAIAKASGNSYLVDLVDRLHDQATRASYLERQVVPADGYAQEHQAILKAIKSHDPEGARQAMAQHVREVLKDLFTSLLKERLAI